MMNMKYQDDVVKLEHLPPLAAPDSFPPGREEPGQKTRDQSAPLRDALEGAERRVILEALERAGRNKTKAARELGISIRTLYNKLARYGL